MKTKGSPASSAAPCQTSVGAVSPSEWKTPGTSPVGENSFGKSDGGDEPWFSEAVATVFMDNQARDSAYEAFTAEALAVKMDTFEAAKPVKFKDKDTAQKFLIDKFGGLDKFLDAGDKAIMKKWDEEFKPKPPPEPKEEKKVSVTRHTDHD